MIYSWSAAISSRIGTLSNFKWPRQQSYSPPPQKKGKKNLSARYPKDFEIVLYRYIVLLSQRELINKHWLTTRSPFVNSVKGWMGEKKRNDECKNIKFRSDLQLFRCCARLYTDIYLYEDHCIYIYYKTVYTTLVFLLFSSFFSGLVFYYPAVLYSPTGHSSEWEQQRPDDEGRRQHDATMQCHWLSTAKCYLATRRLSTHQYQSK